MTYRNDTVTASGAFTVVASAANPFDGIDVGKVSRLSFVDIDEDGALNLVVGG